MPSSPRLREQQERYSRSLPQTSFSRSQRCSEKRPRTRKRPTLRSPLKWPLVVLRVLLQVAVAMPEPVMDHQGQQGPWKEQALHLSGLEQQRGPHQLLMESVPKEHGRIRRGVGNREASKEGKFILDFANLTLFGRKAWSMLASLKPEDKPSGYAFVETHLMGTHLNIARKRLRKMGWKALTTPAVPKLVKEVGRDGDGSGEADDSEETLKKF